MACRVSIPRKKLKSTVTVPSHGEIYPARSREDDMSAWAISGEGADTLIQLLYRINIMNDSDAR